ncbi:MAG: DUF3754 domain-containing protein [Gammaproteobacteria bacterium]|nr:DUF3754 domain-containing protein [Gammaproteobacteria bacterium]
MEVIEKLNKVISFQFYEKLTNLKKQYQPFNPDSDLTIDKSISANAESCINEITELLSAANYSELNQQQIEYALQKISPYGLDIHIDFSAFSNVSLFYRGKSNCTISHRDWTTLYIKKKNINLISYQRLFLIVRYKDQHLKPGIHLKLFKDILRPDLEMLFPECKVRMKLFDKIKLAVTGGGGTAGGLFVTIGKVTAAVNPWTIILAIGGFAMLLWRQLSKIFIQKTRYLATLAQNLYFHNLDNNTGAITYMVDLARQEEIKEVILAYALLNLTSINNQHDLDTACEHWFEKNFNQQIDFDVSDAVDKLKRFKILKDNSSSLECRESEQIISSLENQWLSFMTPRQ